MKLFLIATMLSSASAYADFFFIQNKQVYSVLSKYSPEKVSVERATFFKVGVKEDLKNGSTTYSSGGVVKLVPMEIAKSSSKPKVVAGEGCAENPMSWLKTATIIGRTSDTSIYIQVAPQITFKGKSSGECSEGETRMLGVADKDRAILICADDLNYYLKIKQAKELEADLTITDHCP